MLIEKPHLYPYVLDLILTTYLYVPDAILLIIIVREQGKKNTPKEGTEKTIGKSPADLT